MRRTKQRKLLPSRQPNIEEDLVPQIPCKNDFAHPRPYSILGKEGLPPQNIQKIKVDMKTSAVQLLAMVRHLMMVFNKGVLY